MLTEKIKCQVIGSATNQQPPTAVKMCTNNRLTTTTDDLSLGKTYTLCVPHALG